jgi:hypothetical protein
MLSSPNKQMIDSKYKFLPPFSDGFHRIYRKWVQLSQELRVLLDTSALIASNERHESLVKLRVHSCHEFFDILERIAAFYESHHVALREEARHYLLENRAFVWYSMAVSRRYHPTEDELRQFAFFFEGTWGSYDLSLKTYREDEHRRKLRGQTKNPNYVSTHVCCNNCICYYDDTPDYEWAKEDEAERKVSNNIRINYWLSYEFEREFLKSNTLENMRSCWESWEPTISPRNLDRLELEESDLTSEYHPYVFQVAHRYCYCSWMLLPSEPTFEYLWNHQGSFLKIAGLLRTAVGKMRERYLNQKAKEDDYILYSRKNIRVYQVRSYFEDESRCYM